MSKTDPFREGYDLALGQDRSNRCRNRGGLRVSGSLSVRSTRNVPSSRDVLVVLMPLVSLACSRSSHIGEWWRYYSRRCRRSRAYDSRTMKQLSVSCPNPDAG